MRMNVYLHVCVFTMHMSCLYRAEEDIGSPTTGVKDGHEPAYRCWEQTLGHFHSSKCSLTTEQSLQPSKRWFQNKASRVPRCHKGHCCMCHFTSPALTHMSWNSGSAYWRMMLTLECFTAVISQHWGASCWVCIRLEIICLCWSTCPGASYTKPHSQGGIAALTLWASQATTVLVLYPTFPELAPLWTIQLTHLTGCFRQGWKTFRHAVWGFLEVHHSEGYRREIMLCWRRQRLRWAWKEKCVVFMNLKDSRGLCSCMCTPSPAHCMWSAPWEVSRHNSSHWSFLWGSLVFPIAHEELLQSFSSCEQFKNSFFVWFIRQGLARWGSTCFCTTSTPHPQFWSYSCAPTLGFYLGTGIQTQFFMFMPHVPYLWVTLQPVMFIMFF